LKRLPAEQLNARLRRFELLDSRARCWSNGNAAVQEIVVVSAGLTRKQTIRDSLRTLWNASVIAT
jgi:hypothetical protein